MQGIITKCLIEMNSWKMLEQVTANSNNSSSGNNSKSDGSDHQVAAVNDTWLESQIICDRADVDMEENSEE